MWTLRQAGRLPALSCLTVGAALALVVSAMTTSTVAGAVARLPPGLQFSLNPSGEWTVTGTAASGSTGRRRFSQPCLPGDRARSGQAG